MNRSSYHSHGDHHLPAPSPAHEERRKNKKRGKKNGHKKNKQQQHPEQHGDELLQYQPVQSDEFVIESTERQKFLPPRKKKMRLSKRQRKQREAEQQEEQALYKPIQQQEEEEEEEEDEEKVVVEFDDDVTLSSSDEPDGLMKSRYRHSSYYEKETSDFKRKICIGCAFLCFFIALILLTVLFGHLMDYIFNYDEFADYRSPGHADDYNEYDDDEYIRLSNLKRSNILPRGREFVNELCLSEKLLSHARPFCESACEHFNGCCDIYSSKNGTCYMEHVAECYNYAKCHALNYQVSPAPKELDRVCDPRAIIVSRSQCEDMCEPARCCWDHENVDTCIDSKFEMCQDYSYCQNLRTRSSGAYSGDTRPGTIISVARNDLDQECERETPTCRRECMNARCCGEPSSDCYRDNFIACLSYAACNKSNRTGTTIQVPEPFSRRQEPPEHLSSVCSIDNIRHNPSQCEIACGAAHCCWQSGVHNCFHDDPVGCLSFDACRQLPLSNGQVDVIYDIPEDTGANDFAMTRFPDYKGYVDQICDGETNTGMDAACVDQCQPTLDCCDPFELQDSSCYGENMGGCYSYSRCHIVSNYNLLPAASNQLNIDCSLEAIQRDRSKCEALCDAVQCCWDETVTPCISQNFLACQDYIMCQNLNLQKGGGSGATTIEVAPTSLDLQCNSLTAGEEDSCLDICSNLATCCNDHSSLCYRDNFLACLSYATCPTHLQNDDAVAVIHNELARPDDNNIQRVCAPDFVRRDGYILCQNLCRPAACCFTYSDENCFGADPLACIEYLPCRVLYQNIYGSNGNSAVVGDDGNIVLNDENILFPETKRHVQNICTDDRIESYRSDCETVCKPLTDHGNCCDPYYESHILDAKEMNNDDGAKEALDKKNKALESCLYQELPGCYSYSRCHALDGHTLAAPNDLNETCSIASLVIDSTECKRECEDAHCCWDYENIKPCIHSRFLSCLDYAPCQNLRHVQEQPQQQEDEEVNILSKPPKIIDFLPVAQPHLDELCESNSPECLQYCAMAADCCNDPFGDCYRDNFLSCLSYGSCIHHNIQSLDQLPPIHSLVPPMDPTESNACDRQFLLQYGPEECQSVCTVADCCWIDDTEENGNCFGHDPFGCLEYLHCLVLDQYNDNDNDNNNGDDNGNNDDSDNDNDNENDNDNDNDNDTNNNHDTATTTTTTEARAEEEGGG